MVYDFSSSVLLNFLLNLSWAAKPGRTDRRCKLYGLTLLYFCHSALPSMLLCSCQTENFNTVGWVFSQITCLPQWPQINFFYYSASLQNVIKHTYLLVLWNLCPIIASVTFTLIISRVIFSQNKPQKPRYQYR